MRVDGKFLNAGPSRFHVKGVTYGTFAPNRSGDQFPSLAQVERDFSMMARAGINTVRTYTVPTEEVLDCAAEHGLRLMVGLPWAQHTAFLDTARQQREIRDALRAQVIRIGGHPAVALLAIGNEIPATIVRWHGPARIERFLRQLYDDAKQVRPDCLLTYVNFPPTEYLELSFFDLCAFNVYLHDPKALAAYLARLQHVAGHKPLLLAEAGADSFREGLDNQAALTAMHVRGAFAAGLCGAIAFSWTDEWWRGGYPVEDWAFGLVTAARDPKPALTAVSRVFARAPEAADDPHPSPLVSIVVCAHNAAGTIGNCLQSLSALRYSRYETIVVNDGSTDATGEIARQYPHVRVIDTGQNGLAAARNIGASHASGEIVAYTDADVRVDPDWLTYLVRPFQRPDVIAAGGPNVVPAGDPFVAQCVARAPGGPTHVMLDDEIAEHVPGCNMAIRRDALLAIGGFNPVFLRAGDDVDVCWRLQAHGGSIAFAPSALVWHHHRATVRAYWRQQVGYGEGEAWLRPFHPDKFHGARPFWRGCVYGALPMLRSLAARRVNAGVWGTAAFPSVYRGNPHPLVHLPHSAGWQLLTAALLLAALLMAGTSDVSGGRVLMAGVLTALVLTIGGCLRYAVRTDLTGIPQVTRSAWASRALARSLIALLHYLQPLARLHGQLRGTIAPPRHGPRMPARRPVPATASGTGAARLLSARGVEQQFWTESSVSASMLLDRVARGLRAARLSDRVEVDSGWWAERDISVPVGSVARVDLRMLVEDHGAGRSLVRSATRIRLSAAGVLGCLAALAAGVYGALHPGVLPEAVAVAALLALMWRLGRATRVGGVMNRTVQDIANSAGMHSLGRRLHGRMTFGRRDIGSLRRLNRPKAEV